MQNMQELTGQGSLDELTAFVAVGETGSFTAASVRLGRDASVISKRVNQLEQRLGVRLLSRTTRKVALTEAGAVFFRRVQSVLDELASAGAEASDAAAAPQGLLRVSLPVTFGRQWIAPTFAGFLARYPRIRINAHFTDSIVDVVADGFDVAIRVGVLSDSAMTTRRMAAYRNILVASPEYLKAHGHPRTPAELRTHACLGFPNHPYWPDWMLSRDGKRQPVRPNCSLVADNSEVLLMAACEGTGIALLPDWLVGPAVITGTLTPVLREWTGEGDGGVYAILPTGRMVPAKVRLFVDYVAAHIRSGWQR